MTYDLISLDSEEIKEQYPEYYDDYDGAFFSALVVRNLGGHIVELVAIDGGEPEDQSFRRDWSWVPDALNDAYDRGYDAGVDAERGTHE